MPQDVTSKLSADIAKALAMPDLNERLRGLGTTPVGSTPEELATHVKTEVARWTQVVKTAGVKPE
jgi:tripartite-type tricarboxylate transporter receptor subunit TctC